MVLSPNCHNLSRFVTTFPNLSQLVATCHRARTFSGLVRLLAQRLALVDPKICPNLSQFVTQGRQLFAWLLESQVLLVGSPSRKSSNKSSDILFIVYPRIQVKLRWEKNHGLFWLPNIAPPGQAGLWRICDPNRSLFDPCQFWSTSRPSSLGTAKKAILR